MPAVGLHEEIGKLPWVEDEKPVPSGAVTVNRKKPPVIEKLKTLTLLLEVLESKGLQQESFAWELAARHGFEP